MARILTYTSVGSSQGKTDLEDADVFMLDGSSGVRKIAATELGNAVMDKSTKAGAALPAGRSGLYRGANLGSGSTFEAASTAEQRAAIADGSFTGLFIGDYWTVNSVLYRIADFNYWKRSGDADFNTNHIVLVPDAIMGSSKMNDTDVTTGAYVGSKMYTDTTTPSALNAARTKISTDFGGYLASHKVYLPNAVSNGAQSAGAWYDSTVDLMNEAMVYGCFIHTKMNGAAHLYTVDKHQLALFRLNPAMINPRRENWWLRDVVSSAGFAVVGNNGAAHDRSASNSLGVRPAFAVKGTTS